MGRKEKISDEEFLKEFNKGKPSYTKMARYFNVSLCCIQYKMKKLGLKPHYLPLNQRVKFSDEEFVGKYNEDKYSTRELGKYFGVSHTTIRSRLRKLGLKAHNPRKERLFFPRKERLRIDQEVKEAYKKHRYVKEMAKEVGVSPNTIRRRLKKLKLPIKANRGAFGKYEINSDFFKKDSPEQRYVLGLIASDGNVYTRSNGFKTITFTGELETVERVKFLLNFGGKIHKSTMGDDTYFISFSDKIIANDLISLGIVPRKSLILKFPPIPIKYNVRHFIRGYFDGDGHIGYLNTHPRASICSGSYKFITELKDVLSKFDIDGSIYFNSGRYVLWFKVGDILKLYYFMYRDASQYLTRKKDIFDKVISMRGEEIVCKEKRI